MKVIRGRGAGLRPIVEDGHPGAEIRRESQKNSELTRKGLRRVTDTADCPMARENGRRVAEDEEIVPVADGLLLRGEIFGAEKTGSATNRFRIEFRAAADDAPGVELHPHTPAVPVDPAGPGRR